MSAFLSLPGSLVSGSLSLSSASGIIAAVYKYTSRCRCRCELSAGAGVQCNDVAVLGSWITMQSMPTYPLDACLCAVRLAACLLLRCQRWRLWCRHVLLCQPHRLLLLGLRLLQLLWLLLCLLLHRPLHDVWRLLLLLQLQRPLRPLAPKTSACARDRAG